MSGRSGGAVLVGYLASQAISLAGTRLSMIALPWMVLTTTGSATRTGLVAAAELAPIAIAQALSGPWIDRVGARRVALGADVLSAGVVALIPLAHHGGWLSFPALLGLVFVAGCLRGPGEAARHALVPAVVAATDLPTERVTGLAGTVERLASMGGAAVGGAVVAAVGPADALLVDAGSFLVGAAVLWVATRPLRSRVTAPAEATSSYLTELRDGWRFVRRDRILFGIGLITAITNLLDTGYSTVLLPVWARETGAGVAAVGLVGACFGGAALAGSVVATAYAERLPRRLVFLLCFVVCGLPRFVALALEAPVAWVVAIGLVTGFAAGFLNPVLGAVIFERIPAPMMGRATAASLAMSWSLMPVGGPLAGVLLATLGTGPGVLLLGTAYLLATLAPLRPHWRDLDRRRPVSVGDPVPTAPDR